ncbi:hypothetical protein Btru_037375 [Bulinus truncatus]|nr:hypothetical protein Btru_037375 [Bulinus truncatus]
MELMGNTQEAVYVWSHANRNPNETKPPRDRCKDERILSGRHISRNVLVPWRLRRYEPQGLPTCPGSSEALFRPADRDGPYAPPAHITSPCFSQRQQGNNIFFPYTRQIVGSRILTLPETSGSPDHLNPHNATMHPCGHSGGDDDARAASDPGHLPSLRRDPELPMTPEVGRSARLQDFVRAYGDRAGCYPIPPTAPTSRQKQQADQAKETYSRNEYNSPSSHTSTDMRFMKNAVRTYYRDQQLQMAMGQHDHPNRFVHEGDTDWHRVMMLDGPSRPCPEESKQGGSGGGSQCARVPDGLGGYCYIYPNKPAADQPDGKPMCRNTEKDEGRLKPASGQKVIDKELLATSNQISTISAARDVLYERLFKLDKSVFELKQKLYSLPSYARPGAADDVRAVDVLEQSQNNLLNKIRQHDQELSRLWKHHYDLQCKSTNQLLADVKASTSNDITCE